MFLFVVVVVTRRVGPGYITG